MSVMEGLGFTWFDHLSNVVRRKRSQTSCRPHPVSLSDFRGHGLSSSSVMEGLGFTWFDRRNNVVRRKRSQTQHRPRPVSLSDFRGHGLSPSLSTSSSEDASKASTDVNAGYVTNCNRRGSNLNHCERNSEDLSLGQSGVSQVWSRNQTMVKKVKLKFGDVTRTIQTNSTSNGASGKTQQQSNSDNNHSPSDKRSGLQGLPWKDFSKSDFGLRKRETLIGRISKKNMSGKEEDKSESVRKSKRIPKRRVLDGELSDNDYEDNGRRRSRSDRVYVDTDYEDEEEPGSDVELEDKKKKKQGKESVYVLMDSKRGMTLTKRQQALQSRKDASASGASLIEFPNGLPPAPPRKKKEKLSEMEQQLKKAEAAQKRKMQEKAANAQMLTSSTIRYVMDPIRTTVTFPEEMGIPSILNSKPISYPPPREKCAGPSCTDPFKYRHSKSKLPLCSLQCYKAIDEKMAAETTSTSTS